MLRPNNSYQGFECPRHRRMTTAALPATAGAGAAEAAFMQRCRKALPPGDGVDASFPQHLRVVRHLQFTEERRQATRLLPGNVHLALAATAPEPPEPW
eukprot:gene15976-biopygen12703